MRRKKLIFVCILIIIIATSFLVKFIHFLILFTSSSPSIHIDREYSTGEELNLILQAEAENPSNLSFILPPYNFLKNIHFFSFFPHFLSVSYKANISTSGSVNLTQWSQSKGSGPFFCYNRTNHQFTPVFTNLTVSADWIVEFDVDYEEYSSPIAMIDCRFYSLQFYNSSKILIFYCFIRDIVVS